MSRRGELRQLLGGLALRQPPAALRERVLAEARARRDIESSAIDDPWDRLWESRPLRLAWGVALVLSFLAHWQLSESPQNFERSASTRGASAPSEVFAPLRLEVDAGLRPSEAALCDGLRGPLGGY